MKKVYSIFQRMEDDKPMRIEGYAYKWGDKSSVMGMDESIERGAFAEAIKEGDVMLYMNHNPEKPMGRQGKNMSLSEDETGLKFSVSLPATQDARDAFELIRSGIVDGVSVGFGDFDSEDTEGERRISRADLKEISLTQAPVFSQTEVSARHRKTKEPLPPELI